MKKFLTEIDRTICLGSNCKKCVEACRFGVLVKDGEYVKIVNSKKCSNCGECVRACPVAAIWLI